MLDFLRRLLDADALASHGICLSWRPELLWTHVIADALIAAAYFSIPVALAVFVARRVRESVKLSAANAEPGCAPTGTSSGMRS